MMIKTKHNLTNIGYGYTKHKLTNIVSQCITVYHIIFLCQSVSILSYRKVEASDSASQCIARRSGKQVPLGLKSVFSNNVALSLFVCHDIDTVIR